MSLHAGSSESGEGSQRVCILLTGEGNAVAAAPSGGAACVLTRSVAAARVALSLAHEQAAGQPCTIAVWPSTLSAADLIALLAWRPWALIPTAAICEPTLRSLRETERLVRAGLRWIHLHDRRRQLDPTKLQPPAPAAIAGTLVAAALMPALGVMPAPLSHALVSMFVSDGGPRSAKALAASAGMTRRSLDRWIERSAFRSTRWLVAGAQAARALPDVVESDSTATRIAARHGYASARSLRRQLEALTGLGLTDIRATASLASAAAAIARSICESSRPLRNSQPVVLDVVSDGGQLKGPARGWIDGEPLAPARTDGETRPSTHAASHFDHSASHFGAWVSQDETGA